MTRFEGSDSGSGVGGTPRHLLQSPYSPATLPPLYAQPSDHGPKPSASCTATSATRRASETYQNHSPFPSPTPPSQSQPWQPTADEPPTQSLQGGRDAAFGRQPSSSQASSGSGRPTSSEAEQHHRKSPSSVRQRLSFALKDLFRKDDVNAHQPPPPKSDTIKRSHWAEDDY